MKPLYRATRMPDGRELGGLRWVFACPACEYRMAFDTHEAADTAARTHCRTAGGKAHDRLLVDLLAGRSPMFEGAA